ncbi:hypothetical protein GOP47_0002149, partial [Adiantum capillus-veneris]
KTHSLKRRDLKAESGRVLLASFPSTDSTQRSRCCQAALFASPAPHPAYPSTHTGKAHTHTGHTGNVTHKPTLCLYQAFAGLPLFASSAQNALIDRVPISLLWSFFSLL